MQMILLTVASFFLLDRVGSEINRRRLLETMLYAAMHGTDGPSRTKKMKKS
jgi:hypothetical protein